MQAQPQQQLQVATQQQAIIGGIPQPQQGPVVVTMASVSWSNTICISIAAKFQYNHYFHRYSSLRN